MNTYEKALNIRKKLKRFTRESVINELLKRLHEKPNQGNYAYGMPWVICLMLDWAIELQPASYARKISDKEAYNILDEIWKLQNEALAIDGEKNIFLTLRPFFIQQLMFQRDQITHLYFMVRLYSILCGKKSSGSFENEFFKITGVNLEKFFSFAWILNSIFIGQKNRHIKYSELIIKLFPAFTIDEIFKLLRLVGATIDELHTITSNFREKNKFNIRECFSEPSTINRPIMLFNYGFTSPHSYIATIGISELVMRILKQNYPDFKNKFTRAYEEYIADLFSQFSYPIVREEKLKEFYKQHRIQGKVVDFLSVENGKNIFIDAKGIEPTEKILVTNSPEIIKDRLKSSFIKAIEQACECCSLLETHHYQYSVSIENRYAIIVTHQDFYLGDACRLVEYLGKDYEHKILKHNNGKILLENIFFICTEDFEAILGLCDETGFPLHEFLDFCVSENRKVYTQKFITRQHIEAFAKKIGSIHNSPIGCIRLLKANDEIYNKVNKIFKMSNNYWKGGHQQLLEINQYVNFLNNLLKNDVKVTV